MNAAYRTNLDSNLKLPLNAKTILLIRNLKKRLKSLKILAFDTFLENFNGDNLGYESISDDTFADKLIEFESELPPFFSSSAKKKFQTTLKRT